MRTVPLLTPSAHLEPAAPALSPDETPTVLAVPGGTNHDEAAWSSMPTLQTPTEPEDVPFAMTPAAVEPTQPAEPAQPAAPAGQPDGSGLPGYDTPDIERPAIQIPKAPLPDYETPDDERPAIHVPSPTPPGYDTPDVEHTIVYPTPAGAQFAPVRTTDEMPAMNGSANGTPTPARANAVYPDTYTGPQAGQIGQAATPTPTITLPASDDPLERFFGVQPSPRDRTARYAIQGLWLRHLPPEWAVAPWISIPVGALIALSASLLVTAFGLIFWSRAVGYLLTSTSTSSTGEGLIAAVRSPNLLQLLLLEHGVPIGLALGSPGSTGSFTGLMTLPLTGLSLIPAGGLILAGYVAAASDFSHSLRFSVLRGALVGPVYGLLLLLVALFGSDTTTMAQNTTIQLHPSLGVAFLAGLIWGTLLGALGSLLALRRHHLFTTNQQPDLLAGASWGALISLGSGLLLAAVALIAGMAAHVIGTVPPATSASGGLVGALGAVVVAISLLIVIVPVGALWVFALSTGATLDSWFTATSAIPAKGASTFGLLIAQHHPSSIAWWLLLLIPLTVYIIGGRAAAHIARANSVRDGALVGWLMALALSVLMLVLTLLSRVLISSEATFFNRSTSSTLGIAPSVGAVFLLVLLFGSIIGAFGGVSAVLAPKPGPMAVSLMLPLLARLTPALSLAQRPWDMLDEARNQHPPRTPMRSLIYAAALSAVGLVALFLVVVALGWIASHFTPISAVRGFDGFFAGLAVGVPLLLLASAAILAVLRTLPPLLTRQPKDAPVLPRFPRP